MIIRNKQSKIEYKLLSCKILKLCRSSFNDCLFNTNLEPESDLNMYEIRLFNSHLTNLMFNN